MPLTPYGLFMLEVDAPTVSGASHTGTITFGTEFSIPYNVTSQQATYIFATEQEYNGNLGGLAGADAICQSEADASWLAGTGTYKALLSTSTVNARGSRNDRLSRGQRSQRSSGR